jgi:hypothetical protein
VSFVNPRLQLNRIEERLDGKNFHFLRIHKTGSGGDVFL